MIPDKVFKELLHDCCGLGCFLMEVILSLAITRYVKFNGESYIILESENSSSRKTFVGGMIKAAHFLQGDKNGMLVFVIVPKPNTTAFVIAEHLKPYLQWISNTSNLKDVYIIDAKHYYDGENVLRCLMTTLMFSRLKFSFLVCYLIKP